VIGVTSGSAAERHTSVADSIVRCGDAMRRLVQAAVVAALVTLVLDATLCEKGEWLRATASSGRAGAAAPAD
jgi:hypothetical protein